MMRTHVTRRARLLAGAAIGAVGLLAIAGTAAAQDAPVQADPDEATEIDEVIVTGIRAAIQNSIAAKRNNSSIVEVITLRISASCRTSPSPNPWPACRV